MDERRGEGRARAAHDHPALLDAEAPLGEELDREGIDFMLHGEDAPAHIRAYIGSLRAAIRAARQEAA